MPVWGGALAGGALNCQAVKPTKEVDSKMEKYVTPTSPTSSATSASRPVDVRLL